MVNNSKTYFFRNSVEVLVQAVQQEDQQLLTVLLLERGKVRLVLPQRPSKQFLFDTIVSLLLTA